MLSYLQGYPVSGGGYPRAAPVMGYPGGGGGYPGAPVQQGYPGFVASPLIQPLVDPGVVAWFRAVDTDNSGQITALELKRALSNGNWTNFREEACRLMIGNASIIYSFI